MPVWYIAVYDGTSRYENLIPGYTGIYRDIRNRMVLSRWWGFQMWTVAGADPRDGRGPDCRAVGRPGPVIGRKQRHAQY